MEKGKPGGEGGYVAIKTIDRQPTQGLRKVVFAIVQFAQTSEETCPDSWIGLVAMALQHGITFLCVCFWGGRR